VPDLPRNALRNDLAMNGAGWRIRSNIIWVKTSGNFEPVRDRPVHANSAITMMTEAAKYWYDPDVREASMNQQLSRQQIKHGQGAPRFIADSVKTNVTVG
jgi:hypothetical protein